MKRANDPIFWLPFGAGGVLAALFGPALVLITGFAAPFAIGLPPEALGYDNMMAFAHNAIGKLFLFAIVVFFLWHAALRIYHTLHDFGVHVGTVLKLIIFGGSLVATVIAVWTLLAIGF